MKDGWRFENGLLEIWGLLGIVWEEKKRNNVKEKKEKMKGLLCIGVF